MLAAPAPITLIGGAVSPVPGTDSPAFLTIAGLVLGGITGSDTGRASMHAVAGDTGGAAGRRTRTQWTSRSAA